MFGIRLFKPTAAEIADEVYSKYLLAHAISRAIETVMPLVGNVYSTDRGEVHKFLEKQRLQIDLNLTAVSRTLRDNKLTALPHPQDTVRYALDTVPAREGIAKARIVALKSYGHNSVELLNCYAAVVDYFIILAYQEICKKWAQEPHMPETQKPLDLKF